MSKRYYIAYGSNLSTEQMAFRTPDAKIVGTAILTGWQLLFRYHATIEENPEKNTPVLESVLKPNTCVQNANVVNQGHEKT